MSSKKRVLVVANRSLESPELLTVLCRDQAHAAASITLLVPAVPHGFAWAADMKAGKSEAVARAEAGARRLRAAGLPLERVVVGDPDPFAAAGDALRQDAYDEVVVSTPRHSVSRWLGLGLPDRLRRSFPIPVTKVAEHVSM